MFWRKTPRVEVHGRFWMTDAACTAGFLNETSTLLNDGVGVFIVTHFADTHKRISQSLLQRNVQTDLVSQVEDLMPAALRQDSAHSTVPMIPFPVIQLAAPFAPPTAKENIHCAVVVPEIYPTRQRDSLVQEFVESLPFTVSLRYYVSMESPVMRRFGGKRIGSVMQRLGLSENEVVEHPWLTKSFQAAQERIARLVKDDRWAPSMEEWFALNESQLDSVH